ncbi:hypothetical protein [Brevundimonas sp. TWP2-3-4b1]|uniref:hypothetical protein n=1 Tax=Brevundimonas sp. TWP2-3-4b1 TaxID=2804580 RepID=UPI003CF06810
MQDEEAARAAWMDMNRQVSRAMLKHVKPCVTPITSALQDETSELIGSGGYVEHDGRRLLVTAQHVATTLNQHSLAHRFHDSDNYYRVTQPFHAAPLPIDVAASPLEDHVWNHAPHKAWAFPQSRVAQAHAPFERELFFLIGFAGSRHYFSPAGKLMITPGTPYLTQEVAPPPEGRLVTHEHFDPAYHFALEYLPEAAETVDEGAEPLPENPKGFSGALVWNTRFVECTSLGQVWSPQEAVLTGTLWAWLTSDRCLLATRIEHAAGPLAAASAAAV